MFVVKQDFRFFRYGYCRYIDAPRRTFDLHFRRLVSRPKGFQGGDFQQWHTSSTSFRSIGLSVEMGCSVAYRYHLYIQLGILNKSVSESRTRFCFNALVTTNHRKTRIGNRARWHSHISYANLHPHMPKQAITESISADGSWLQYCAQCGSCSREV